MKIYTDGAVRGNPGEGGWAARLEFEMPDGKTYVKEVWGVQAEATNNQMELQAIVEGIAQLRRPCRVDLFSDSRCAIAWIKKSPPKENIYAHILASRYRSLLELGGHRITLIQIAGHSGIPGNERVDAIAYAAARGLPIPAE